MIPGPFTSPHTPRRAGLAALLGLGLSSLSAHAATVLMFLNYTAAGQTISTKVKVTSGLISAPARGIPLTHLDLRPGETVSADTRPADRTISFYSVANGQKNLLFFLKARYYSNYQGAGFRIFNWRNNRW